MIIHGKFSFSFIEITDPILSDAKELESPFLMKKKILLKNIFWGNLIGMKNDEGKEFFLIFK